MLRLLFAVIKEKNAVNPIHAMLNIIGISPYVGNINNTRKGDEENANTTKNTFMKPQVLPI